MCYIKLRRQYKPDKFCNKGTQAPETSIRKKLNYSTEPSTNIPRLRSQRGSLTKSLLDSNAKPSKSARKLQAPSTREYLNSTQKLSSRRSRADRHTPSKATASKLDALIKGRPVNGHVRKKKIAQSFHQPQGDVSDSYILEFNNSWNKNANLINKQVDRRLKKVRKASHTKIPQGPRQVVRKRDTPRAYSRKVMFIIED